MTLSQVVPDPYTAPFNKKVMSRRIVWTSILIFTQVMSLELAT